MGGGGQVAALGAACGTLVPLPVASRAEAGEVPLTCLSEPVPFSTSTAGVLGL